MTNQSIPKRSEVPEEMTWNLKDMFESDQAVKQLCTGPDCGKTP